MRRFLSVFLLWYVVLPGCLDAPSASLDDDRDGDADDTSASDDDAGPDDDSAAGDDDAGPDDDSAGDDDTSPPPDADGDGFGADIDCNDGSAAIHPGAVELCDGIDEDCDGLVDEDFDSDGDGFATCGGDCDDGAGDVHPGAAEVCNGVDDDCDAALDEGFDGDGDGFLGAADCPGVGDDCDDGDPAVSPAAEEVCSDGVDNDCDEDPAECRWWGPVSLNDVDVAFTGTAGVLEPGVVGFGGDFDGDGYDEVLVGSNVDDAFEGAVYVWQGPIGAGAYALGGADAILEGSYHQGGVGVSVAGVGDVDGDGTGDILAGACTSGGTLGYAWLVHGPPAEEVLLEAGVAAYFAGNSGEYAGWYVSPAGDLDGDGLADLLIGSPRVGKAYILYGPTSGESDLDLADAVLTDPSAPEVWQSTRLATGVGDVNGDGYGDVLMGCPEDGEGASLGGSARLYFGPLVGTYGRDEADVSFIETSPGAQAGWSVASAGDVNGDGEVDLVVGAPMREDAATQGGIVYVLFGPFEPGEYGLSDADVKLEGIAALDRTGWAVDGAGDFDGDGYGDLIVGAPQALLDGSSPGRAFIVYGPLSPGTHSIDGVGGARLDGPSTSSLAGFSVAGGGDVNGDGFADVLLTAPSFFQDGSGAAAWLVYGRGR
ncbi:hypothetical protein L6R50_19955 [Myxococcota bacterium]|nr:hypothetical protein [Myxococcota bacterium]